MGLRGLSHVPRGAASQAHSTMFLGKEDGLAGWRARYWSRILERVLTQMEYKQL